MKTGAWLGVVLLCIIVVVVTYAATFLPYERAMALVYGKAWFAAIFAALAAALVTQIVRRRPRARRFGPPLIHLGMLIIIAGGFLTWGLAVRGRLMVREGHSSDSFELEELFLTATLGSDSGSISIDSLITDDAKRSDLDAQIALVGRRIVVLAERYMPDPQKVLPRILPLDEGFSEPTIVLSVFNKGASDNITLFANSPDEQRGAAYGLDFEFIFVADRDEYSGFLSELTEATATSAVKLLRPPKEQLVITTELGRQTINLKPGEAKVGLAHSFAGQEGRLKIRRYVPDFVMDRDMQVSSRSSRPNNPAIQVELQFGSQTSTMWVFGKSRGFHAQSLPTGVSIEYRFEAADAGELSRDERGINVLAAPGQPFVFVRGAELVATAEVGDTFPIPGTGGVHVTVENFWGSASRRYQVIEGAASGESTTECVRVSVRGSSGKALYREWVPIDTDVILPTPEGRLKLVLERPSIPLGFEVFLEKFEARTYPGSMMPSAYISTMAVNDRRRGESITCTISPNNPLDHGHYKLYQSAYDEAEDGAMVSILGVSRDPGTPAFYVGSICLIVGMLFHFFSNRKRTTEAL